MKCNNDNYIVKRKYVEIEVVYKISKISRTVARNVMVLLRVLYIFFYFLPPPPSTNNFSTRNLAQNATRMLFCCILDLVGAKIWFPLKIGGKLVYLRFDIIFDFCNLL